MTSRLFEFDIYAYEIFNAINGRNFHLESLLLIKFHTILKNLTDR
jgi:hypothetical protein